MQLRILFDHLYEQCLGLGDLFGSFTVLEDTGFDGSVILHVSFLDEKSSKCSPEDGEDSSAENAEWSNSELEVKFSFSMHNCIVIWFFERLIFSGE